MRGREPPSAIMRENCRKLRARRRCAREVGEEAEARASPPAVVESIRRRPSRLVMFTPRDSRPSQRSVSLTYGFLVKEASGLNRGGEIEG